MPILPRVGTRSLSLRITVLGMYVALTLGSVAMIYPFLVMLSGSTKSAVDSQDLNILPPYLIKDDALYRKYVESLFNESLEYHNYSYMQLGRSYVSLTPPDTTTPLDNLWREFEEESKLPSHFYMIGATAAPQSKGVIPLNGGHFRDYLRARFGQTEAEVNRALSTTFESWSSFEFRPQGFYGRGLLPRTDPLAMAYRDWQETQPPLWRNYFNITGFYLSYLRNQNSLSIETYNRRHGTHYTAFEQITLNRLQSDASKLTPSQHEQQISFVRRVLNPVWIQTSTGATAAYQNYLKAKYQTIESLNRTYQTSHLTFNDVVLPMSMPSKGALFIDWDAFIQGWQEPGSGKLHQIEEKYLSISDAQFVFRDYLRERFTTVEELNRTLGTNYQSFEEIMSPIRSVQYQNFLQMRGDLRWEFSVRNYRSVWGYLVVNGRGVVNTLIFCSLSILAALIFNPMAAYALSRFRPPLTYKILLFLMLTMAFPPMVTQVPVFLMLRDLNLLNTFAALILPGLANGYSIFLLKGFFDSLPRELYESADLDGASEWVVFWQITMSLSKPILAVIALGAFNGAYSAFTFALLICQDQSMWTIMVWLYQLQQRSGEGVIFASLIIAAIPTMLVFLFAQNIIMRGIAVPVEK